MAWYKDKGRVHAIPALDAMEVSYQPGTRVVHSGIYGCVNCRREVTVNSGDPFPPPSHHTHTGSYATFWKLLVLTDTEGRS